MAVDKTVLVIEVDGSARELVWPAVDTERQLAVSSAVGSGRTKMRRCGKGILGFHADDGAAMGKAPNRFAASAFAEQGVELDGGLYGAVLFARNPSKGSEVKPLTAAQSANLLVVTGASLS